jgi:methyltransferase-like protein
MARDMLLFHTREINDPQQKVDQAVALGAMIAKFRGGDDPYQRIMQDELDCATAMERSVLFHDQLSPHLSHLYYVEFVRRAADRGLQFLAEADYYEMQHRAFPQEIVTILEELAQRDPILKEQYLDFLKCRRFRQTLLCHAELPLQREPLPERVVELHLATTASVATPRPDLAPGAVVEFRARKGTLLATDHPLSKAALIVLRAAWPQALPFRELLAEARKRAGELSRGGGLDEEAMTMAEIMLRGYESGLLELHLAPLPLVTTVSDKPRASAFARWQLETRTSATTLRHTTLDVEDALGRHLIQLLDGTHDRKALVAELAPMVAAGLVSLSDHGKPVNEPERAGIVMQEQLEPKLQQLARLGLLEG